MRVVSRNKREFGMWTVVRAGYSRKLASIWYKKTRRDRETYKGKYPVSYIKKAHKDGRLCSSLEKYNLNDEDKGNYISDLEYLYLSPFNNSFSKWLQDIMTTNTILKAHEECLLEIYFSIINRNGEKIVLRKGNAQREYTADDIAELLIEKGKLVLRPAFWLSSNERYILEYKEGTIFVNEEAKDKKSFKEFIDSLPDAGYIVCNWVDYVIYLDEQKKREDSVIRFWISNDIEEQPVILSAIVADEVTEFDDERELYVRLQNAAALIDIGKGTFEADGVKYTVSNWDNIKKQISAISADLKKLNYFSLTVATTKTGSCILVSASASPALPGIAYNSELNVYLKDKYKNKINNRNVTLKDKWTAIKKSQYKKFVAKHCTPGIRTYMHKLWVRAVWDDLWHTKVSLPKKIWAWKRGFLSYRIDQYGLTKDNYKQFLSDYQYYWLNRINNSYQIWINDKTTYRYILDPFKEFVPDYYYSIWKRNGITEIEKMMDCPADAGDGIEGILELVRQKGKLALKPSAGTHGDGFYCLAWEDGNITVNGEIIDKEGFKALLDSFKSFYLITEYIVMHEQIKKIYDKSVNSVRILVINEAGYNPKIMQSYMRIGSSRTGYTDNVGYGGICVMVDPDTGELYNPETIADHKFYPCPVHPDTNTEISGKIPHWELVCEKVLEICRYLSELEYLGFDIAITEDGFQVIEINIHPDLHKVPTLNDEVKAFFAKKISLKEKETRR